jgi:hypothetical protein
LPVAPRLTKPRNEAIALGWNSLYKVGRIRVVVERDSEFPHRGIDGAVYVQKDGRTPHAFANFLARYQLSGPFGQKEQHIERNPLELYGTALAAEPVGFYV